MAFGEWMDTGKLGFLSIPMVDLSEFFAILPLPQGRFVGWSVGQSVGWLNDQLIDLLTVDLLI